MRISDWSSDVCSSDLLAPALQDDWGTAVNPGPDGIGSAAPGGSSLVVFAGGAHDKASWDLVARLTASVAQLALHEATGDLPARRSVWTAAGDRKSTRLNSSH